METNDLVYVGLGVCFWLLFAVFMYNVERRDWNRGISPSGHRWTRFDMDSQGGRMYHDNHGNSCHVSYPFVDRDYQKH